MALNLGDVYYKIQANTAGLQSATRQIKAFGKSIEDAHRKAVMLNKVLSSTSVQSMQSVSRSAQQASSSVTTSATRQQRALSQLALRYDRLKQAAQAAGAPVGIVGAAARSLNQFEQSMKSGAMTADQFAIKQGRVSDSLGRATMRLQQFRAQQDALVRQTRALSIGREQTADVVQQARLFGGADPKLIGQAEAAFQKYHKTLSGGVITSRQLAAASSEFHSSLGNVRRSLLEARTVGHGFFASMVDGIKSVGTAFAAFLIFQGLQDLIGGFFRSLDELTNLDARLGLTAKTVGEVNEKFEALFEIAKRTRQPITDIGTLYNRIALSAKALGLNEQQTLDVTEAFAASLVLSGAAASEARAATIQFSQALASGRLQGDEFRSVLENNRVFAALLAKQLAGGSIGALFKMREEGKLTAKAIAGVATSIRGQLLTALKDMPITMSQATNQLGNEILKIIRSLDKGIGFTRAFANVILFLADNARVLIVALGALVGLLVTRLVGALVAATVAGRGLHGVMLLLGATPVMRTFTLISTAIAGVITYLQSTWLETTKIGDVTVTNGAIILAIWDTIKTAISDASKAIKDFFTFSSNPRNILENFQSQLDEAFLAREKAVESMNSATNPLTKLFFESKISNIDTRIADISRRFNELRESVGPSEDDSGDSFLVRMAKMLGVTKEKIIEFQKALDNMKTGAGLDIGGGGEAFKLPKELESAAKRLTEFIQEADIAQNKMKTLFAGGSLKEVMAFDDLKKAKDLIRGLSEEDLLNLAKHLGIAAANGEAFERILEEIANKTRLAGVYTELYVKALTGSGLNETLQLQLEINNRLVESDSKRVTGTAKLLHTYGMLKDQVTELAFASEEELAVWQARQKVINEVLKNGGDVFSDETLAILKVVEASVRLNEEFQRTKQIADSIRTSMGDAFQDMFRQLRAGELSWKSFEQIAVAALERILEKLLEIRIIAPLVNSILGNLGIGGASGGSSSGGSGGGGGGGGGSGITDYARRGGAFALGGRINRYARGGIVRTPTHFRFANGAGLMGEAGPEGVFPLSRMPNGDLGVRAEGSGGTIVQVIDQRGASAPPVEQEQSVGSDGRMMVRLLIRSEFQDMLNKGSLDKSFRTNFGVRRRST